MVVKMTKAQTRVVVINEARIGEEGHWNLCFQYCRYEFGDGKEENGYRFIWRTPEGNLQATRGQARIPSISDINYLTGVALKEGWGHHLNGPLAILDRLIIG
jgi:hypothetical protein